MSDLRVGRNRLASKPYRAEMDELSVEQIEASRARLGVDPSWEWSPCAGRCGDIVWHPGLDVLDGTTGGRPVVLVCSTECAKKWMTSRER